MNHRNLLDSNDLLMLNDSANAEAFKELKPRYFILLDPAYFRPEWKVVDKEVGNEGFYLRVVLKLIENLKSVDWNMTLLLPANKSAKNMANLFVGHKYVKVEEYNTTYIQGFEKFRRWAYKMGLGIPSSRNIVIPALLQMISRGYDTIYLYGTEFSWIKFMDVDSENGRLIQNDCHFYSKDEIRYYEKGAFLTKLENITDVFRGIESVAAYAKKCEVHVINRTKRSFIDSFDYENIDKI
ncbi:MAG: hypothetical protein PHG64_09870 [Paludibacter sp.]|nr:hypothetical protein [Paludibacter sp.]